MCLYSQRRSSKTKTIVTAQEDVIASEILPDEKVPVSAVNFTQPENKF